VITINRGRAFGREGESASLGEGFGIGKGDESLLHGDWENWKESGVFKEKEAQVLTQEGGRLMTVQHRITKERKNCTFSGTGK